MASGDEKCFEKAGSQDRVLRHRTCPVREPQRGLLKHFETIHNPNDFTSAQKSMVFIRITTHKRQKVHTVSAY